jgi:hypothetical protein
VLHGSYVISCVHQLLPGNKCSRQFGVLFLPERNPCLLFCSSIYK